MTVSDMMAPEVLLAEGRAYLQAFAGYGVMKRPKSKLAQTFISIADETLARALRCGAPPGPRTAVWSKSSELRSFTSLLGRRYISVGHRVALCLFDSFNALYVTRGRGNTLVAVPSEITRSVYELFKSRSPAERLKLVILAHILVPSPARLVCHAVLSGCSNRRSLYSSLLGRAFRVFESYKELSRGFVRIIESSYLCEDHLTERPRFISHPYLIVCGLGFLGIARVKRDGTFVLNYERANYMTIAAQDYLALDFQLNKEEYARGMLFKPIDEIPRISADEAITGRGAFSDDLRKLKAFLEERAISLKEDLIRATSY